MASIKISKDIQQGKILVSFAYDPKYVAKVKTIEGHKWHPEEKQWIFPDSDRTLEKILNIFEGEKIHLDTALQTKLHSDVIASPDKIGTKQSQHNFQDFRRELVSRKYSYKTVKSYIYYNRDFLNFDGRSPSDINDNDIKNYLLHLAEEKHSATSTLNQAINALKFYYGTMLKRKFVYEVRRPRKDKKLP